MTKKATSAPIPDSKTTMARVHRAGWKRLRILAAQRGVGPGVLLNRILENRAALKAALAVVDEETNAASDSSVRFHGRENT